MNAARPRRVAVAGATGLIGRALLREALAAGCEPVHALVRRDPGDLGDDARLRIDEIDFVRGPIVAPAVDELYVAIGTTIKLAGSEAAFRRVDLGHVVAIARAARSAGASRLAVVSALGADAGSRVLYSRVKGEMETAVGRLGYDSVVFARPSLLAGDRGALGQPARPAERLALTLLQPLRRLLPASVRPVDATVVARALLRTLPDAAPGVTVLESARLQRLGARKPRAAG